MNLETIYIEQLNSNAEVFGLVDRNFPHILIDRFWPHDEAIEWWVTSLKINSTTWLENFNVRDMQMDIQTDLLGLEQIMSLNSNYLQFYQFDRPISDTLTIRDLPEIQVHNILINNGLRHIFKIRFEQMTIESVDKAFIQKILGHDSFKGRVFSSPL